MARPRTDPNSLSPETRSMLAQVAWGRLTASEAAHRLRTSPQTVTRQVQALFGVSATAARRQYADRLAREAISPDPYRDTRIRAQMIEAARAATDLRDPCQPDQPSPQTDTK